MDQEAQSDFAFKQDDTSIRLGFVRKVYSILTCQLGLTVLMCMFSMMSPGYLAFQKANMWLFYVTLVLSIIICFVCVCFSSLMRQVPTNYCLLLAFTLCEGYLVSLVCGLSKPKLVMMAAFMTLAITVALTLYAFTTKTDFTMMGGALWILGCVVLMFSLFAMFTDNNLVHIIICCVSIIMYALYLIYDTQLIMGGKKHELSMDDYCLGALMLYIDIIGLFLEILQLLERLNKD